MLNQSKTSAVEKKENFKKSPQARVEQTKYVYHPVHKSTYKNRLKNRRRLYNI